MSEEEYIWCEYCDEYKVPKCETKDYLIEEFLEDIEKGINNMKYTPCSIFLNYLKEKWEKIKNE